MGRSGRRWLFRVLPLLGCGAVVLMLLPGGGKPVDSAGKNATPVKAPAAVRVAAAAPATLTRPTSSFVTPATAAAGEPAPPAKNTVTPQRLSAVSPSWSAYIAPKTSAAPPAEAEPATNTALSDGQVGDVPVNVRSGPSTTSPKLFVLAAGEAVKIGETNGGWVHIHRSSGEDGWVSNRYMAGAGRSADNSPAPARVARRTSPAIATAAAHARWETEVRAAPDPYSEPLFLLEPGDRVRIAGARGNWLLVVTEDGMSGWIPS